MSEITATEAARRFADLLDAVEHAGERYTITRHGRAVAQIEPVSLGRGADVKELLRQQPADPEWAEDLRTTRSGVYVEQRP